MDGAYNSGRHTIGSFPEDYMPTLFDNYASNIVVNGQVPRGRDTKYHTDGKLVFDLVKITKSSW